MSASEDLDDERFDLTILPMKKTGEGIRLRREYHRRLPEFDRGAVVAVLGKIKSGKSLFGALNMSLNENMAGNLFDDVIYFSTTLNQDDVGMRMKEAFPSTTYDHFSEKKLESILDGIQNTPKESRRSSLFILDDFAGSVKTNSLFFDLASRIRHYSASLIYLVQGYKQLPLRVRNNVTSIFIGRVPGMTVSQVAEEHGSTFGGKENLIAMHRRATAEPYNFLYLRLDSVPPKAHRNLEKEILYVDD